MNKLILKSTEVNSTSIIPNFGAIMKMGKTFMYNEFLKYDDGKLAKFIAAEKGIDEAAAKEEISEWVASLNRDLDTGKTVVFDGVGELVRVDGKLKFTAKAVVPSTTETVEKSELKEKEAEPIKEAGTKSVEKDKKVEEKEVPKKDTSLDYKAKEVVEKLAGFTDKTELIDFTRGDSRKTVVAALNAKLDELNGKKKEIKPTEEELKSSEVKAPKNVVTEIKSEPKEKTPETEEKESSKEEKPEPPKKEEKPLEKVDPVIEKKVELKTEEPVKQPLEEKAEDKKPTIKEKAASIEKPKTDVKEEEEAIAAIVNGVEKTEKEKGKRKKRWILWVALILILAGGGTLGFLKKDMIMGWFEKKHEPKDLAEGHDEELNDHESSADHSGENTDNEHSSEENTEASDPVTEETAETTEENSEEVIEEPIVEEPVVEEPIVKESPVVSNSSSEGDWHIVAGSYSSEANAESKVEKLKSMGYTSAKVLGKYNGLYTVRVSSYTSKDKAKAGLESFKNSGNDGFIKKL